MSRALWFSVELSLCTLYLFVSWHCLIGALLFSQPGVLCVGGSQERWRGDYRAGRIMESLDVLDWIGRDL